VAIILLLGPRLDERAFLIVVPFLTPIAAMGGNAGVQVSTVVVRALATGDIMASSLGTALAREFRIVLLIGLIGGLIAGLGTLAFLRLGILPGEAGMMGSYGGVQLGRVSMAVGSSMAIAILLAGLLAATLPFAFRRLGIDPAIATGPVITTINDAMSAGLYLLIAIALLN
jgi:magnesium transporter